MSSSVVSSKFKVIYRSNSDQEGFHVIIHSQSQDLHMRLTSADSELKFLNKPELVKGPLDRLVKQERVHLQVKYLSSPT